MPLHCESVVTSEPQRVRINFQLIFLKNPVRFLSPPSSSSSPSHHPPPPHKLQFERRPYPKSYQSLSEYSSKENHSSTSLPLIVTRIRLLKVVSLRRRFRRSLLLCIELECTVLRWILGFVFRFGGILRVWWGWRWGERNRGGRRGRGGRLGRGRLLAFDGGGGG